jgi:hypothetical protein
MIRWREVEMFSEDISATSCVEKERRNTRNVTVVIRREGHP